MPSSTNEERAPLCVSEYEIGDKQCDGDPDGETTDDKAPCGWRDRCAALQCYLAESSREMSEFVELKAAKDPYIVTNEETGEEITRYDDSQYAYAIGPWKKFEEMCDKHVQRYGIKEGKPNTDPVGDPPAKKPQVDKRRFLKPSKKAQRAAKKAISKSAKNRRGKLQILFQHFLRHLATELKGTGYRFVTSKQALGRRCLYVVDRLEKSGYMSVYCNNPTGRDAVVATAKFKPRGLVLDLSLTVGVDDVSGAKKKGLGLVPIDDGLFKSLAPGLGTEGVALAAETIAALVRSGKIILPGAAL